MVKFLKKNPSPLASNLLLMSIWRVEIGFPLVHDFDALIVRRVANLGVGDLTRFQLLCVSGIFFA